MLAHFIRSTKLSISSEISYVEALKRKNLSKKRILDLNEQDPPNIQDLKSSKL